MTPSNIERRNEVAEQVQHSLAQVFLGFMPAGHVVNEFLNFRSNLKQKRVLKFSESVQNALSELSGKEIDDATFTTEEFVDIFESIIQKVQNSNSEYKLQRFRNILVKQILEPADLFSTLRYIQLLDEMNDLHVIILLKMEPVPGIPLVYDIVHFLTDESSFDVNDDSNVNITVGEVSFSTTKLDIEFCSNQLVSMD